MNSEERLVIESDAAAHPNRVWFRPCNAQEADKFEERCCGCSHFLEQQENEVLPTLDPPYVCCSLGILDKIILTWFSDEPHECFWHAPDELQTQEGNQVLCPPRCLKFQPKRVDNAAEI